MSRIIASSYDSSNIKCINKQCYYLVSTGNIKLTINDFEKYPVKLFPKDLKNGTCLISKNEKKVKSFIKIVEKTDDYIDFISESLDQGLVIKRNKKITKRIKDFNDFIFNKYLISCAHTPNLSNLLYLKKCMGDKKKFKYFCVDQY